MPELAITTHQLRKVYGNTPAVASLDLAVPRGEIFGFLGPNGAGKSTCVKMLLGLVFPTGGSGTLLGAPLGDRHVKAEIGFLPELFRFHEWFTAREFLDFHGQLYGMSATKRRQRISDVLALVNLEHAAAQQLPVADKPDSHEICFVPDGDYASFVARQVPGVARAGAIVDQCGDVLGSHGGVHRFVERHLVGTERRASGPAEVEQIVDERVHPPAGVDDPPQVLRSVLV